MHIWRNVRDPLLAGLVWSLLALLCLHLKYGLGGVILVWAPSGVAVAAFHAHRRRQWLLLALVLGPQLEEHLRIALTASHGDISIFFTKPFSLLFLCLSVVSVVWSVWLERRHKEPVQADVPQQGN